MRTLYEDWQLRRARLDTAEQLPHFGDQVRVFDYLLSRYVNDPIAQEPARFPHSSELIFNNRAIIVHRDLKCGEFGATRNPADAHTRARTILARIAKLDLQADACAPSSRINIMLPHGKIAAPFGGYRGPNRPGLIDRTDKFIASCKAKLSQGGTIRYHDLFTLKQLLNWTLCGHNFKASLSDILEVLSLCADDDITCNILDSWTIEISNDASDLIMTYLRKNDRAAEILRRKLASDYSAERTRAAHLLGRLGSLNDIGLLQDLLALPEMKAESPERAAYLSAMNYLAGVDGS